ncbi:MAG: PAS domain S-box protein, partial [Chitinophagaceae bacterium]|nr:PAS domain S-box protein [Anaerolineae bacterium]
MSRPLLRQALQDAGYTVFSVKSDRALWSALVKSDPDIIILDAELGDGYAVCARLKMLASQIPVVMIVPPTEEAITRARASGAEECIVRPIQPSLLLWRVESLLNERETIRRQLESRLFDSVNDAIFLVDLQHDGILEVNRHASKLLGYSRGEFLAMRYRDVVGEAGYKIEGSFVQELTTKGHFLYEQVYRSKAGWSITVEVSSRVIDYDGKKAILSFARDIRKRKQAEAAAEEQRHLAEALRDTAAAINSTLNLSEVVQRILEHVNRVVPSDAANMMLVVGEYAPIVGHRGHAWFNDDSSWFNPGRKIDELGTIQWMMQNRRAMLVEETSRSRHWKTQPVTNWVNSFLGVPIISNDEVIGFINLDSKSAKYFTPIQIEYLTAFADQASIAIRNAQLYEATQRYADELEVHVARRTQELIDVNLRLKEQIVERQRIEAVLNSERNLLRTLMDALPDHIYAKDREGRFLLGNVAGAAHIGVRNINELVGKTDFDLYPKEIAAQFYDEEQQIIHTGQPVTREISPRDEQKWFLMTKVALRDSSGEIIGLVGINRDITETKEAEARIQHVISGANCLLGYTTAEELPNKRFAWNFFVTSEATALTFLPLELQPRETYRDAFWRCIPKEDQRRIVKRFSQALQNDERVFTMEFKCRRSDDQMRWLNIDVQSRPLTPGRWTLVSVTTDITERKALETAMQEANQTLEKRVEERTIELSQTNIALRQSEARFRVLVEHAPEAIVVFDPKTERFVDVNENAVRLFGMPKKKLLLHGLLEFSPPQQPDGTSSIVVGRRWIQRAVNGEIPVFEWVHRSANGRDIACEVRLLRLPTSDKVLLRGSITDITERKKAEQAEREQRMLAEALGDAAAALSSSLDLDNVLDRILHYVARVMPQHEISAVMLIEDGIHVRVVRQNEYGNHPTTTTSTNQKFYLDSLPELRFIFETDRPIAVTDTQDAPNLTGIVSSRAVHSYVAAPIHAEGRVIGFVYLGSSRGG